MNISLLALGGAAALAWQRRKHGGAVSLPDKIPTCEVVGSTVLNVDGALAFGFQLRALPFLSSSTDTMSIACDNFAELLRRIPEGVALQFISQVTTEPSANVRRYCGDKAAQAGGGGAAAKLAIDVSAFTETQTFRSVHHCLFVTLPYEFQSAAMARATGAATVSKPQWNVQAFDRAVEKLAQTADAVRRQMTTFGLRLEPMAEAQIVSLAQAHLNPGRMLPVSSGAGFDSTDSPLRPLTLRERLASSDIVANDPRTLTVGDKVVRVMTMKALPDATFAGLLAPLFFGLPDASTVSVCVEKLPAETTLASLKMRRSMARGVASLSAARDIDAEVQHSEIEAVLQSLSQSSACLCAIQLTCAVQGQDANDLSRKVSQAEQAFTRAGGLATFFEDYSHFEAYMSMLPGASHRFRRARTVLDANAAQMALPVGEWEGCDAGALLTRTRTGAPLLLDPFDDKLPAFNGLVVGATGSGKSFLTNLVLANHLASGGGAVVIDIGGSYRRLTSIFGGTYIDVADAGLNPFLTRRAFRALGEERRQQTLQFIGGFLEMRLVESGDMPTSERAMISKTLAAFYAHGDDDLPVDLGVFQTFLREFGNESLDDEVSLRMARRLDLWTTGPRAALFSRPINLSLTPKIISIDLKSVEDDPELMSAALYVLSFVIWGKVSETKRKNLIVFDECWAMRTSGTAMRLIESLYRTLRKYGAGIWCLSQSANDFISSPAGPALLANTYTRILLQHAVGHDEVADICSLTDNGRAAFRTLSSVRGEYSEAFVQFGDAAEVLRVVPSPLEYWMATTNARDKALEADMRSKHPEATLLQIVTALAKKYPRGAR